MLNKLNLYPVNSSNHSFSDHEAFLLQKLCSTFLSLLPFLPLFSSSKKNRICSSRNHEETEEIVYSTLRTL